LAVMNNFTQLLLDYFPGVRVYSATGNHEGVPVGRRPLMTAHVFPCLTLFFRLVPGACDDGVLSNARAYLQKESPQNILLSNPVFQTSAYRESGKS